MPGQLVRGDAELDQPVSDVADVREVGVVRAGHLDLEERLCVWHLAEDVSVVLQCAGVVQGPNEEHRRGGYRGEDLFTEIVAADARRR